jgi:hypothetical protein
MTWENVFDQILEAQTDPNGSGFSPIPPTTIYSLTGNQLVIRAVTTDSNPIGWLAFRLVVLSHLSDFPDSAIASVEITQVKVPLDRNFFLELPVQESYSLRLEVPVLYRELNVRIWQRRYNVMTNNPLPSAEVDQNVFKGQPLYIKPSQHLDLAVASSLSTSGVIGLAVMDANTATSVDYISSGLLERQDWTAIVGSTNLSAGAIYYLSPNNAGHLTTTAPTSIGQVVAEVGRAMSNQVLNVEIQPSIVL